jgi:hypothetical protein
VEILNKIAIASLAFWLLYNSLFAAAILGWTKASPDMWAWAIVPVIASSFLMVAVTVGNQNKDKQ